MRAMQDYAKRSAPRKRKPAPKRRKRAAASADVPRRLFHGPSFSGGVIAGALGVMAAAYLPDLIERPAQQPARTAAAPERELRFRFDEVLRTTEVVADATAYDPTGGAAEDAGPIEYHLQVGSFRSEMDADELRATLILQGLPTQADQARLDSGTWHRVTVGPFPSELEAQRALTALRRMNLNPMWITRPAESGRT